MNNDQISAFFWFLLGVVISIASINYKLGTLTNPGAGFMPFLSGMAICLFSLVGLFRATFRRSHGERWKAIMEGAMWGKPFIVLISLIAYTVLLKYLGFSLCTAILIGVLLRIVQPQRWPVVIAGAISSALVTYVIFEVLLQTQLPNGPWGF